MRRDGNGVPTTESDDANPPDVFGGPIPGGRILDYTGKPNRKMCSLYLSMMDRFGVREKAFGDSTERLAEI